MVVVPNTNVARKGVVIEPAINLGRGSGGFSTKSLSRSLGLPTVNIRVSRTSQMVFTNPMILMYTKPHIDHQ
jgi:hypothetical protein